MNDFHSNSQGHPLVEDLSTALLKGSVVFSNGSNLSGDNSNFFWNNSLKRILIGTNTTFETTPGIDILGNFDLFHIAIEDDDHAMEICCDADGFGDVKALDIFYTTGPIVTGQDEEAILIQFDEFDATGGDLVGLEVLTTEGGADMIAGLFAGVLVDPIKQLSGVFADMDSALVNAVDELADLINEAEDTNIFVADDDTVTIGDAAKFEEIEFILTTVSSGAGIRPKFEFSTGVGTWTEFNPTDGTNAMRNNGVIAFLDSDIPTWAVGTGSEFLIRITRQRNSLTTTPVAKKVQIAATTEYSWDKDGAVTISSLDATGKITSTGLTVNGAAVNFIEDSGAFNLIMTNYSNNAQQGPQMVGQRGRGTEGTPLTVVDGDALLRFGGKGYDGTGFSNTQAQLRFDATETWDATSHGTKITLNTTDNGTTTQDVRMTIGQDGTVTVENGAIFNESGGDNDFRVEGDTNTHLIFAEASSEQVSIGMNPIDFTQTGAILGALNVQSDPNLNGTSFLRHDDGAGGVTNRYFKSRGTFPSPTALQENDSIMRLQGLGYTGAQYRNSAQIRMEIDGSVSNTILPTRITWHTANSSGTRAEKMRLDKDGRLGIGTSTPNAPLDINGEEVILGPPAGSTQVGNTTFTINSGNNKQGQITFVHASNSSNIGNAFVAIRGKGTDYSAPTQTTSGFPIFRIACLPFDQNDDLVGSIADIVFSAAEDITTTEQGGKIEFFINPLGGTSLTTIMTLVDDSMIIRGSSVFNEDGGENDFRVEGDTLTHMLFLEANASSENVALLAASLPNWQSMDRGIFIGDATTAPTGNPTSGYFIYIDPADGKLYSLGPGGTTTIIGRP